MSYDICLREPATQEAIQFDAPHQIAGGVVAIGGTTEAWLNVTYNYSKFFYNTIDPEKGIRKIYGMTGAESIPLLEHAISLLKDDVSNDYWDATEGNAKQALLGLIAFAKMRPDGIWDGD